MKIMTSAEVRQAFLDFFAGKGHKVVPSSSLVPGNDPTLLFTNAGMVQFKDVFLGLDKRDYTRATTAQKCMRVSGKHNDLENVGPSPRHHTFFEMLGNFSFGDYFKLDAIKFAYECLTEVYGIPPERLYYTVHENDDEAFSIWRDEIGIPEERIYRMGDKTNFWQMADVGPCGPTSEIHYDLGPEHCTCGDPNCSVELDNGCDRWLELWNLVFMQFNRDANGHDEPLPAPGVDTGMGMERLVSVIQGQSDNYSTDLFMPIILRIQQLAGKSDDERLTDPVPYRVIADHIRAATFLIADGVTPGASGRNSVCRMVIRRAAYYGTRIGFHEPFLADVAEAVIETMGDHYTELKEKHAAIRYAITLEEERFGHTLGRGLAQLGDELDEMERAGQRTLPGDRAFFYKATMGLPLEVIRDVCRERGLEVDENGYMAALKRHEEISGGGKALGEIDLAESYREVLARLRREGKLPEDGVEQNPYRPPDELHDDGNVLALMRNGEPVQSAISGDRVEVVMPRTPFYVESGGQVSDTGVIEGPDWLIEVEEAVRPVGGLIVHRGEVVEGSPRVGDPATVRVNAVRRYDTMRNHTATHILHSRLREVLGEHVQQAGSLVSPDRLRFDFTHHAMVTQDELSAISRAVNEIILRDLPVVIEEKPFQQARQEGAIALFDEKYGDIVRTVSIRDDGQLISYELCGGTHVSRTSEIGPFVIVGESSVGSGLRRIEAVTGHAAADFIHNRLRVLENAAAYLGVSVGEVDRRILELQDEMHEAHREIARRRRELARREFEGLLERTQDVEGVSVLAASVSPTDIKTLREMTDWFRNRVKSGVVVLGTQAALVASVTRDLARRGVNAGELIGVVARMVGGKGGGGPTMATAGVRDAEQLDNALAQVPELVRSALNREKPARS